MIRIAFYFDVFITNDKKAILMNPYTTQWFLKTSRSWFISFSKNILERILALVRKRFELCGKGLKMKIYLRGDMIWNKSLTKYI